MRRIGFALIRNRLEMEVFIGYLLVPDVKVFFCVTLMRCVQALRLDRIDQIEHWTPIISFLYISMVHVKLRLDIDMCSCQ